MTPVEIAYFKHFLFDMGVQAIYISMYRRKRIKGGPDGDKSGNPESLEQFLQEQPHFRVLKHAFYFDPNSNFGYDYWNDINKKWEKYRELHEENPRNTRVAILKGTFAILRQNWDRPEYWKVESMEATYARMHMEPPLKDVDLETAFDVPYHIPEKEKKHKFKVGDIIQGNISEEVLTIIAVESDCYKTNDGGIIDFDKEEYWTKIDEAASEEDIDTKHFSDVPEAEEQKSASPLDGFSLVNSSNNRSGRRLASKIVSVNIKNGYRVTFSSEDSKTVCKNKYNHVQLLTNDATKEIALKFNSTTGCIVNIKGNKDSKNKNVVINARDIAENIHKFYNLPKDNDYFRLKIVSTTRITNGIIYILKYDK